MDERKLEIRVGLLFGAALAAGLALLWLLGGFQLHGDRQLSVDFAYAGGVPVGAPLKFAGVHVGRVKQIELLPARRDAQGFPLPVCMHVELTADALAAMHEDAAVAVATQGPLGEPYLEISPGSADSPPLRNAAELRGVDPARLDVLASRIYRLLDFATAAVGDDPKSISSLLHGTGKLAETVDQVLTDNREALTQAIHDAADAAADLHALLQKDGALHRLADDSSAVASGLRRDYPELASKTTRAANGAAALVGGFSAEDGERLKDAISRYEAAGQRLDEIATRADAVLKRVEAGEGSLGGFYKDPQVYQDLKALVTDLKKHPWKVLWKD
jgi:phospholipid/cholesterol/gamma-HCH transport system substrate-binding protein